MTQSQCKDGDDKAKKYKNSSGFVSIFLRSKKKYGFWYERQNADDGSRQIEHWTVEPRTELVMIKSKSDIFAKNVF